MSEKDSLVSVVLPAYNEEQILADNLAEIHEYLQSQSNFVSWEMIVVNDGSSDQTGSLAEDFAANKKSVQVIHHHRNMGLGGATKTGIHAARGDVIVILDVDLSYGVEHIEWLWRSLTESGADVVLASPYMSGGKILHVPFVRRILSIAANKFLSKVAHGRLSTLTCMVRAFNGDFARALVLRSTGMDVMPETVYKTMIMRGRLVEIPAVLDWRLQAKATGRTSSMRIFRQIIGTLLSGFLFRPFMFFIVPGLVLLAFSIWVNSWMVIHFLDSYALFTDGSVADKISMAIAHSYQGYPHTFIVGLLSLMLAIQLTSLGILALQSKTYFEEIFYLGSTTRNISQSRQKID